MRGVQQQFINKLFFVKLDLLEIHAAAKLYPTKKYSANVICIVTDVSYFLS